MLGGLDGAHDAPLVLLQLLELGLHHADPLLQRSQIGLHGGAAEGKCLLGIVHRLRRLGQRPLQRYPAALASQEVLQRALEGGQARTLQPGLVVLRYGP